jgi:ATP-binding protein involved in chromosome partitioning
MAIPNPEAEKTRLEFISSVVAIGSCKGGVGKTTVAVNLALAFRRGGARVGLFDADLYGPNVPLMLGIRQRRDRFPLAGLTGGRRSVSFIPMYRKEQTRYIQPVRRFGLQVMSLGLWFGEGAAVRDPDFLGGHLVRQALQDTAWEALDILLIDLPPGTGGLLQVLLQSVWIDGMVVVTTPQEMALLDTGRSIDLFRGYGIRLLGRVENMSYFRCPHCGETTAVFAGRYEDWQAYDGLPLLGAIPLDPALGRAVDARHPFTQTVPDSPQAKTITAIAEEIRRRLADSRAGPI